ncbi:MAG: hypothetical protein AAB425_13770 [Bdellovibrionota bacterium]
MGKNWTLGQGMFSSLALGPVPNIEPILYSLKYAKNDFPIGVEDDEIPGSIAIWPVAAPKRISPVKQDETDPEQPDYSGSAKYLLVWAGKLIGSVTQSYLPKGMEPPYFVNEAKKKYGLQKH